MDVRYRTKKLPHVATVRAVASNRAIASRTCSAVLVVAGVVAGDPPSLEKGRESEKESHAGEEPSRSCPCRRAQLLLRALRLLMGLRQLASAAGKCPCCRRRRILPLLLSKIWAAAVTRELLAELLPGCRRTGDYSNTFFLFHR
ncbi:uncharacterized protein LOC110266141 [Arachis ipaensis]|uniref:uncharacterized protein LOC110266141 n=1 Tax=Arachis ipaensis TaxID=130454 RepID=UPI000A2B583E|nr:uncharacterized protein LOC110266141 [Arachis ipaensis]